ncbi:zinc ribbon domain-containing protein [Streptomyces sp. NPDC051994]|uniref:zinc ribbon domain-containing protein n=1 Tax=unclassified Streptomyces TaxID=2593676 RepID=UPI00343FF2EC
MIHKQYRCRQHEHHAVQPTRTPTQPPHSIASFSCGRAANREHVDAVFECTQCGHQTHADIGAAHNIKHRALDQTTP